MQAALPYERAWVEEATAAARGGLKAFSGVAAALCGGILVTLWWPGMTPFEMQLLGSLIPMAAGGAVLWTAWRQPKLMMEQFFRDQPAGTMSWSAAPEGLVMQGPRSMHRFSWTLVEGVEHARGFVVVQMHPFASNHLFIPEKAFHDRDHREAFMACVRSHLARP